MGLSRRRGIAGSVVGALTLGAAFPPWSVSWLAPVGVAMFISAVGRRPRLGAMAGAVFGLVFIGFTSWWLAESIALAAWAALTLVHALWFGLLGTAISLLRRLRGWPVWVACVWTTVESARSAWPWGGFPWAGLGYTALDTPWVGSIAVLGVAGAGTFVALMGGTVSALAVAAAWRPVAAMWAGILATIAVVPIALATSGLDDARDRTRVDARSARVVVVQAEVPGDGTDVVAHHRTITKTLLDQTHVAADRWRSTTGGVGLDLVVWPENATAVDPGQDRRARGLLVAAARAAGAPMLAGSIVVDGAGALNQSILWTSSGPGARYTKQHLVPFGEYVPMRPLANLLSDRVSDITRDMTPGAPATPMSVKDLRVANALCFDVAYHGVIRGQVSQSADLVVVQTSNAMFLGTSQQEQQWTITRARAVEVGRSVVVSSMNGISGVLGPDGSVLERLPDTRAAAVVLDVPIATATTPAVLLGPWPARAAWTVATLSVLAAAVQHLLAARRSRASDV